MLERHLHVPRVHQPLIRALDADAPPWDLWRDWIGDRIYGGVRDLPMVLGAGGGRRAGRSCVAACRGVLRRETRTDRGGVNGIHRHWCDRTVATEHRSGPRLVLQ